MDVYLRLADERALADTGAAALVERGSQHGARHAVTLRYSLQTLSGPTAFCDLRLQRYWNLVHCEITTEDGPLEVGSTMPDTREHRNHRRNGSTGGEPPAVSSQRVCVH